MAVVQSILFQSLPISWALSTLQSIQPELAHVNKVGEWAKAFFLHFGCCHFSDESFQISQIINEVKNIRLIFDNHHFKICRGMYSEVFNISEKSRYSGENSLVTYEKLLKDHLLEKYPMPFQTIKYLYFKGALRSFHKRFEHPELWSKNEERLTKIILDTIDGHQKILISSFEEKELKRFLLHQAALCYREGNEGMVYLNWASLLCEWANETKEANSVAALFQRLHLELTTMKILLQREVTFHEFIVQKSYQALLVSLQISSLPQCVELHIKTVFRENEFQRKLILMVANTENRLEESWRTILASIPQIEFLEHFLRMHDLFEPRSSSRPRFEMGDLDDLKTNEISREHIQRPDSSRDIRTANEMALFLFDHLLTRQEWSSLNEVVHQIKLESTQGISQKALDTLNKINLLLSIGKTDEAASLSSSSEITCLEGFFKVMICLDSLPQWPFEKIFPLSTWISLKQRVMSLKLDDKNLFDIDLSIEIDKVNFILVKSHSEAIQKLTSGLVIKTVEDLHRVCEFVVLEDEQGDELISKEIDWDLICSRFMKMSLFKQGFDPEIAQELTQLNQLLSIVKCFKSLSTSVAELETLSDLVNINDKLNNRNDLRQIYYFHLDFVACQEIDEFIHQNAVATVQKAIRMVQDLTGLIDGQLTSPILSFVIPLLRGGLNEDMIPVARLFLHECRYHYRKRDQLEIDDGHQLAEAFIFFCGQGRNINQNQFKQRSLEIDSLGSMPLILPLKYWLELIVEPCLPLFSLTFERLQGIINHEQGLHHYLPSLSVDRTNFLQRLFLDYLKGRLSSEQLQALIYINHILEPLKIDFELLMTVETGLIQLDLIGTILLKLKETPLYVATHEYFEVWRRLSLTYDFTPEQMVMLLFDYMPLLISLRHDLHKEEDREMLHQHLTQNLNLLKRQVTFLESFQKLLNYHLKNEFAFQWLMQAPDPVRVEEILGGLVEDCRRLKDYYLKPDLIIRERSQADAEIYLTQDEIRIKLLYRLSFLATLDSMDKSSQLFTHRPHEYALQIANLCQEIERVWAPRSLKVIADCFRETVMEGKESYYRIAEGGVASTRDLTLMDDTQTRGLAIFNDWMVPSSQFENPVLVISYLNLMTEEAFTSRLILPWALREIRPPEKVIASLYEALLEISLRPTHHQLKRLHLHAMKHEKSDLLNRKIIGEFLKVGQPQTVSPYQTSKVSDFVRGVKKLYHFGMAWLASHGELKLKAHLKMEENFHSHHFLFYSQRSTSVYSHRYLYDAMALPTKTSSLLTEIVKKVRGKSEPFRQSFSFNEGSSKSENKDQTEGHEFNSFMFEFNPKNFNEGVIKIGEVSQSVCYHDLIHHHSFEKLLRWHLLMVLSKMTMETTCSPIATPSGIILKKS